MHEHPIKWTLVILMTSGSMVQQTSASCAQKPPGPAESVQSGSTLACTLAPSILCLPQAPSSPGLPARLPHHRLQAQGPRADGQPSASDRASLPGLRGRTSFHGLCSAAPRGWAGGPGGHPLNPEHSAPPTTPSCSLILPDAPPPSSRGGRGICQPCSTFQLAPVGDLNSNASRPVAVTDPLLTGQTGVTNADPHGGQAGPLVSPRGLAASQLWVTASCHRPPQCIMSKDTG